MVFKYLAMNLDLHDEDFDMIYPLTIQQLSRKHWTPVEVAKAAADFLVKKPGTKVLDIGSGVGKFCLIGASSTQGIFTGIEQRENLVELSNGIAVKYGIPNAYFIHANITEIEFSGYNAFYFYNSFQENIEEESRIDASIATLPKYYAIYSDYVNHELSKRAVGTRLVTYWSALAEVPSNYQIQFSLYNGLLKFWEKTA